MRTYSMTEAAELIGVKRETLRKWLKTGVFRPSIAVPLSVRRNVWRWTAADVEKGRRFRATRKPGPKPKNRGRT